MTVADLPSGVVDEAVALPTEAPRVSTDVPGPMGRARFETLARREVPFMAARRASPDEAGAFPPIVLASGQGSNLVDVDGNRYIDLIAGFGSVLLGHGSPCLRSALSDQADRLVQGLGDVYPSDAKIALLERLAGLHPDPDARVLLTQSGGDALTAAIKTSQLATGRPGLVSFTGAYHGLGHGPLAACGLRDGYRLPFAEQLNPHVTFAPYPRDASEVEGALGVVEGALRGGVVGAVVVEPILGRGGCRPAPSGFLRTLVELAHRYGALVIADEVWTGLGRSGAWVRSAADGAAADLLCFGKGLGGGLSISACVGTGAIMSAWGRDDEVVHTSTHAGAPLSCAAALATLDAVSEHHLVERSEQLGREALDRLDDAVGVGSVRSVRGEGLMIGVELESAAAVRRVLVEMRRRGYLMLGGGRAHEVITLTPALTIPRVVWLDAIEVFRQVLRG